MAAPEQQSRRASLVEAAVWIGIVVVCWILSGTFGAQHLTMSRLGPELWPRAVLILILVAAVGQLLTQYRSRPAANAHEASDDLPSDGQRVRAWASFLLPIVWVALMPRTGFYLATPLFIAAYLYLLGERSFLRIALVTVVVTLIALLVFTTLFYVALPVGNWPVFYDFSNWLLAVIR